MNEQSWFTSIVSVILLLLFLQFWPIMNNNTEWGIVVGACMTIVNVLIAERAKE